MGRVEMYGSDFPRHYAQAWAIVHYLFSRDDKSIDLLLRGKKLKNIEQLESGWKKYVKHLK